VPTNDTQTYTTTTNSTTAVIKLSTPTVPGELVIIPSNGDGYVELARTRQGRLFRKHILTKGPLRHPKTGENIDVDDTFVDTMKKNFTAGVCPIVQVPLANEKNEHSEAPDRNIGEVIGIEDKDDKVYALIDVRAPGYADQMGKTLLGASAMLSLDYEDTSTGKKVGPTLLHSCVTNRPYVTGLEDYEEVVAATSDRSQQAVLLTPAPVVDEVKPEDSDTSEETTDMPEETQETKPAAPSLEELLAQLKTNHNIDVPALQAKAAEGVTAAELSNKLTAAIQSVVPLTNTTAAKDTVSTDEMVSAVAELAKTNVALSARVNGLEQRDAEHAVDDLIKAGRVLPAQRTAMVELKLTNSQMFDQIVPAQPVVKLSEEKGVTTVEDTAHKLDVDAEIARLTATFADNDRVGKK
jgi:hypothetical protein